MSINNPVSQERVVVKGVIFDFDGTLANTVPVCIAAFRQAIEKYSHRLLSDEEIVTLFGPDEEGCIRQVVTDHWQESLQEFFKAYEAVHDHLCPAPFPGIPELLQALHRQGIRTAIVTGKSLRATKFSLGKLGLASFFDRIEPGSAEGPIKPRGIRKIREDWNIPPERIAYVGDSPDDIHSARAAGVIPISAAWAPTTNQEKLKQENPDLVFFKVQDFQGWLFIQG